MTPENVVYDVYSLRESGILSDVTYGRVSGLCICIVGIRCIRPLLSAPIVVATPVAMCGFLNNVVSFKLLNY